MLDEPKKDAAELVVDPAQLYPVLPLRDVVVYPYMVLPLFVGRERSIKALELAMLHNNHIFLVAQKKSSLDEPTLADLYRLGTVATVLQLLRLPDGTVKILVEGLYRARAIEYQETHMVLEAKLEVVHD